MHPSGVKFGLSQGLLRLWGKDVILCDSLLEAISAEAQVHLRLGKPPIQGNLLVDMTVRAAQNALGSERKGRPKDINPFFAGLNQAMYYTCCHVAERAGLAHKEPKKLITDPGFWEEFSNGAVDIKITPGKNMAKLQKSMFKVCHDIVKKRFAENDPDNVRHADLIAIFMFNFWNATGLLPMVQATLILGSNL